MSVGFANAKDNSAQQCSPQDISPGVNTIAAAHIVAGLKRLA
ncbi:hypothetical protein [Nostoc parmelioides]|nr:hypothetical protein [Nostoc parmelioides]